MGLFTTTTKRTYHRTQPKRGWSTTSKASTRAKRWARRKTKGWWRTTKRRIRNRWKRYQRKHPTRKQQIARTAQQFQRHHAKVHARIHPTPTAPSYELDTNGNLTPTNGTTQAAATGRPPPPDGALASCRRCANEVEYNAARERWEHTGHGDWECFQPHRS